MRDLVILFIHLLTTAARLATRGGLRSVVAVRAPQTSTPNPQSLAPARSPSPPLGPPRRRFVRSVDAAVPPDPFRHRSETFDSLAPPPGPEEPKVSPPLLFPAREQARAQRTPQRTH